MQWRITAFPALDPLAGAGRLALGVKTCQRPAHVSPTLREKIPEGSDGEILPPTVLLCCMLLPASPVWSQFGTPMEFQLRGAESQRESERTQGWKVGIEVEAALGPCFGIYGTFSVPTPWPEQDVKIVQEHISDTIRQSRYRDLDDGVRQMLIVVPRLEAGEKAEAVADFRDHSAHGTAAERYERLPHSRRHAS